MSLTKVRTPKDHEKFVAVVEIRAPRGPKEYAMFEKKFGAFKRDANKCFRKYFPGTLKVKRVVHKQKKVKKVL